MNLDKLLRINETVTLGTHTFTANEIKNFAGRYDPQSFHVDEEAARDSIFGRLCASGWHTASMWMRFHVSYSLSREWQEHLSQPPGVRFGPSSGLRNLRWLKPVYAGDSVTFTQTPKSHRPLAGREGWHILVLRSEAFNQHGAKVIEFDGTALFESPVT